MKRRTWTRATAILVAACLASAGVASAASADEATPEEASSASSDTGPTVEVRLPEPVDDARTAETPPPPADPDPPTSATPAPRDPVDPEAVEPAQEPAPTDLPEPVDPEPAPVMPTVPVAPVEAGAGGDEDPVVEAGPGRPSSPEAPVTAPEAVPVEAEPAPVTEEEVVEAIEEVLGTSTPAELTEAEVLAVAAAVCGAGEICVDQAGQVAGAYADIQAALDAAALSGIPGQVIRVFSGEYSPFAVTTAVQILVAEGAEVVVTIGPATGLTGVRVIADDVVIDGLTLQCLDEVGIGVDVGLWTETVGNTTISRVTSQGCGAGVVLTHTENATITSSTFVGSADGGVGVDVYGSSNVAILDSVFSDLSAGVVIDSSRNVTVAGNAVTNTGWGLHVVDSRVVEVVSNAFVDLHAAASFYTSAGILFDRNLVVDATYGVSATGVDGFQVSDNLFVNSGVNLWRGWDDEGNPVARSTNVSILDNWFLSDGLAGNYGLFVDDDTIAGTVLVSGNIFWDFQNAVYVGENPWGTVDARDNLFGWCGPHAVDQAVDLGGSDVFGSSANVILDLSGCRTVPAPRLTITEPTCAAGGTYEVPGPMEGIATYATYRIDLYPSGVNPLPETEGQVFAESDLGYHFGEGRYESEMTIPAAYPARGCDPVRPAVAVAPVEAPTPAGGRVLATTGADEPSTVILWAASMLLLGIGAVLAARRRGSVRD